MLEQVERREYHTKVPSWIRKMMKKKEKRHGTIIATSEEVVMEVVEEEDLKGQGVSLEPTPKDQKR